MQLYTSHPEIITGSTALPPGLSRGEDISSVRLFPGLFPFIILTQLLGELFSVSPYMLRRLENLFVLNERVSLLGRWKNGFFGMVPVGATNVGSIKIAFDQVCFISSPTSTAPCAHKLPQTRIYARTPAFADGIVPTLHLEHIWKLRTKERVKFLEVNL